MPEEFIECPNCGTRIPLSEAVSHKMREQLEKEFDRKTQKLIKDAEQKARNAISLELNDLKEQISEKDVRLKTAQEAELELRKQQRTLEEDKKNFELDMTRRMDEERVKIKEDALRSAGDEHRLKDLEKDKVINDMKKQVEELKRKAEQGSQQTQGEVVELELEEMLKFRFPHDAIEPVPKGISGADVIQKVRDPYGRDCGAIIWESKQTKAWTEGWIQKLKDDQRDVKARLAVLMTTALPKDISGFDLYNGVWVTDHRSALALAVSLRSGLMEAALARMAASGKNEKMEAVYDYLSGPEFRQKIEAIVEAFNAMQDDLDKEKQAMTKIWAKRDKQIQRVIDNTVGMYGDMQGLIGDSMPEIENLELKSLTEATEELATEE